NHMIKTIQNNAVNELTILIGENRSSNPVDLLLQISSMVRSLGIIQKEVRTVARTSNYFFGVHDLEWATFIPRMFKEKLDKLFLRNNFYHRYLPYRDAASICKNLPTQNKKIWFEAKIHSISGGEQDYSQDGHAVKISYGGLSVKHFT
ncbi:hypothetical protein PMAYCL1PPCAC_20240, partial [Pristionchus mayeri]